MEILARSKRTLALLALGCLVVTLTASCDRKKEIDALFWVGSPRDVGIVRDVVCTRELELQGVCKRGEVLEEFLAASKPSFANYRCLHVEDYNRLVAEAMKKCRGVR
jgi:hypothetical protein